MMTKQQMKKKKEKGIKKKYFLDDDTTRAYVVRSYLIFFLAFTRTNTYLYIIPYYVK